MNGPIAEQSSYNTGGMIVFMGSVIFTLLFFVYVTFMIPGVDLKEIKTSVPASQQPAKK